MPYDAPFQVRPSAEEIQDPAGEHVLHQGVDGEIPAGSRTLLTQKGIDRHREILMPSARGSLGARHGNIQLRVL